MTEETRAHGLVLAAGAGSRMGKPKALVYDTAGHPWLTTTIDTLLAGGCSQVTVVLGAGAAEAAVLLAGTGAQSVVAADWEQGMSASLRTGLAALTGGDAVAAVVMLVDTPDIGPAVVRRVLDAGVVEPGTLRRAAFGQRPGHPVVIGRDHWAPVMAQARGDDGARAYLAANGTDLVECGDLADGRDADAPGDIR